MRIILEHEVTRILAHADHNDFIHLSSYEERSIIHVLYGFGDGDFDKTTIDHIDMHVPDIYKSSSLMKSEAKLGP